MKRNLKKKGLQQKILCTKLSQTIDYLISEIPTEWLILLNASYDSLITGEKLSFITEFIGFIRLEMFYGGPFTYIQFDTHVNAEAVLNSLDGFKNNSLNKLLLLSYANNTPTFPPRQLSNTLINGLDGLTYIDDFISIDDEAQIISCINQAIETQKIESKYEALQKRTVLHFGYRFNYEKFAIDRTPIEKIPDWCVSIFKKYMNICKAGIYPDQLTINHYQPGDGIPPHCDTHSSFLSPLVIVSLGSSIIMDFANANTTRQVLLKRGSLCLLDGDFRYGYEHSIKPRKIDLVDGLAVERGERFSLTFRTLRDFGNPCECSFKDLCK
jgi:alkylated DNA repair protein alkB family protein 8